MPRPERLLDPNAGPLESFAHALRALRKQAGSPSYRVMSKRAHYSVATLSEAARGLHRPSLKVTLAYVAACGGDPETWTHRWYALGREQEGFAAHARGQPDRTGLVPAQPGIERRGGEGRVGQGRVGGRAGEGRLLAGRDGARRTAADAPATDALTADERAELASLRSEVEELRHTNEVLKAASAIFAADLRTTSQVVYNSTARQDRLA
ncbi:helix-turn-helix domain-containing protein [Streptomyces sp. NPDC059917]|uniref:helix-turn-helix domain-containing protein n=1 Tax=Streptomyces sp. NPDC059917 TaxID=3347002 RepID=UPI00366150C0